MDYLGNLKVCMEFFKTDRYRNYGIRYIDPQRIRETYSLVDQYQQKLSFPVEDCFDTSLLPADVQIQLLRTRLLGKHERFPSLVLEIDRRFALSEKTLLSIKNLKKVFTLQGEELVAGERKLRCTRRVCDHHRSFGLRKTTLLKIIAGLPKSEGEIHVDEAMFDPTREVGFVFQKALLLNWRRVLDNVLLQSKS